MTTLHKPFDIPLPHQSKAAVTANTSEPEVEESTVLPTYRWKFLGAVVVSLIVIAAVTLGIFYALGMHLLEAGDRWSDESLSGNISIIIGGAVAFAGSYVAVTLAGRAVDLTVHQVALTKKANQIAARQAPEAEAAVAASQQYARFKSMLLSMPALLRKAHRDKAFAAEGDASTLQKVAREIERSTQDLLQSNVPATVIDIAAKMETPDLKYIGQIQGKRYFEYALSSLFYDLATLETALKLEKESTEAADHRFHVLMRLLHALYSVVREIDKLIIIASGGPNKSSMTEFQQLFLDRALPVAVLNRGLWLSTDFDKFRNRVFKLDWVGSAMPLAGNLWQLGETKCLSAGGLILALHESGHAEALVEVQRALLAQEQDPVPVFVEGKDWKADARKVTRKQVPIFFIAGDMDQRIQEVSEFIKQCNRNEGPGAYRWKQAVVLVDQVDQDQHTYANGKHLTMQDAFESSACFKAVDAVLKQIAVATSRFYGSPVTVEQRLEVLCEGLTDSRQAMLDLIARSPNPSLARQEHAADIAAMVQGAAQAAGVRSDLDADRLIKVCNAILEQDWQHGKFDAARIERSFPPLDPSAPDYESYTALVDTVRQLALQPLLERPLYGFTSIDEGMVSAQRVDLDLGGATLLGVAYLDSRFKTKRSSLVNLLATDRRVYSLF